MPARLRPTAPIAADAILVGDPGRALLLAQALLQQPKMSNHARGLWGYGGVSRQGRELTIQATGMGGPSATVVLADLADLGVRRALRIGTGAALGDLALGELLVAAEARRAAGARSAPDRELTAALAAELAGARRGSVISLDDLHTPGREPPAPGADVADMQTAALFAAGSRLGIAVAALLIVSERDGSGRLRDEDLEAAAKRAGEAVSVVLST
jgi:purine-nucleoside phosphorylase